MVTSNSTTDQSASPSVTVPSSIVPCEPAVTAIGQLPIGGPGKDALFETFADRFETPLVSVVM